MRRRKPKITSPQACGILRLRQAFAQDDTGRALPAWHVAELIAPNSKDQRRALQDYLAVIRTPLEPPVNVQPPVDAS